MLKERRRLFNALHRVAEASLVAGATPAAYLLRQAGGESAGLHEGLFPYEDYTVVTVATVICWVACLEFYGLYKSFRTRSLFEEAIGVTKAAVSATLLVFAALAIFRYPYVSRAVVGLAALWSFMALSAVRTVVRVSLRNWRRQGFNFRRLVIVGTGSRARQLAVAALNNPHWGIRPVGFVAAHDHTRVKEVGGVPVLGTYPELAKILTRTPVDEVMIAVPPQTLVRIQDVLVICGELGIRMQIAMNFAPRPLRRFMIDEFGSVPTLSIMGPQPGELRQLAHRLFDFVGAGLVLALTMPLWLAVIVAIRLLDGAPVFFRQTRCGLKGRTFTLYKFRTMVRDAEAKRADLLAQNEMTGPVFKLKDDPRVTRLGRFLRRNSLDELPQLWNVLRGDMGLVGPRPPLPDEVARYSLTHRRRLAVKPGLTGLWQVSGRNEIKDFDQWMEMDLEYVDSRSFSSDLRILAKTIPAVIKGRGAV